MLLIPLSLFVEALSIILRISFTPLETADISYIIDSVDFAIIRARVVFPVPGGPHSILSLYFLLESI